MTILRKRTILELNINFVAKKKIILDTLSLFQELPLHQLSQKFRALEEQHFLLRKVMHDLIYTSCINTQESSTLLMQINEQINR